MLVIHGLKNATLVELSIRNVLLEFWTDEEDTQLLPYFLFNRKLSRFCLSLAETKNQFYLKMFVHYYEGALFLCTKSAYTISASSENSLIAYTKDT